MERGIEFFLRKTHRARKLRETVGAEEEHHYTNNRKDYGRVENRENRYHRALAPYPPPAGICVFLRIAATPLAPCFRAMKIP
jgi:hypothetical protein